MSEVWIVAIVIGIPVVSGTITRIAKLHYRSMEQQQAANRDTEVEALSDIQAGLRDLKKRVENLETILLDLDRRG